MMGSNLSWMMGNSEIVYFNIFLSCLVHFLCFKQVCANSFPLIVMDSIFFHNYYY